MKAIACWKKYLILVIAMFFAFYAGWKANAFFIMGDEAIGTFMSEVSALAYLQKGDSTNAMLLLRDSAERNLILAKRNSTYLLERQFPGATDKWIIIYAKLRTKLPSTGNLTMESKEFDREINGVITEAVDKRANKD